MPGPILRRIGLLAAVAAAGCVGGEPSAPRGDAGTEREDAGVREDAGRLPPDAGVPACANGVDDDGDGRVDLDDPGCDSAEDGDERDPAGGDCSDGVDNDADGLIDFGEDPGCDSASDGDEVDFLPGDPCERDRDVRRLAIGATIRSELAPGSDANLLGQCGGIGRQDVWLLTVPRAGTYVLTTDDPDESADVAIYVRRNCADPKTEIGCRSGVRARLTLFLEEGDWYVIVDNFRGSGREPEAYVLRVVELLDEGEECDPEDPGDLCAPGLLCREDDPDADTACLPPRCRDGVDNDGDGAADHPAEPGCEDPDDNDEADPDPLPACANGADDDGDGWIDWPEDPGCPAASEDDELALCVPGAPAVELGRAARVDGTTAGQVSNFEGSCGDRTDNNGEDVYLLRVPEGAERLEVRVTTSGWDSGLYAQAVCGDLDSEVACVSDGVHSTLVIDAPSPGLLALFVDGNGFFSGGPYTIEVIGDLADGGACDPRSAVFACAPGSLCDAGVCRPAACADGEDNDLDGLVDLGEDPGCEAAEDDDEADPDPAPACADGEDNDGDGLTDMDDPGCRFPGDPEELDDCGPDVPVTELTARVTGGNTSGGSSVLSPGCAPGADARERAYVLALPGRADVRLSLSGAAGNAVLYVRETCQDRTSELGCVVWFGGVAVIDLPGLAAGRYFVVVDRGVAGDTPYTITVDATLHAGEPCNPGGELLSCPAGHACRLPRADLGWQCAVPACRDGIDNDGDGLVDHGQEFGCLDPDDDDETDPDERPECSDGVDNDGDGEVDFPQELGCTGPGDDDEADECGGATIDPLGADGAASGELAGESFQGATCFAGTGPEDGYLVEMPGAGSLYASTREAGTDVDTGLSLRGQCTEPGSESACANPESGRQGDRVLWRGLDAGRRFLLVDGVNGGAGPYSLLVRGLLADGEPCAPGDAVYGCSGSLVCDQDAAACRPRRCDDGEDDDGDGLADFAEDPGCASPLDDDEADDAGGAACGNGLDDDGDGLTDVDDPGCQGPGDEDEGGNCAPGVFVKDVTGTGQVDGTTAGGSNRYDAVGACNGFGAAGNDRVFRYRLERGSDLRIETMDPGTGFNAMIYVRTDCETDVSQIGCANASGAREILHLPNRPPGEYFIFLDGVSGSSGPFDVRVTAIPR